MDYALVTVPAAPVRKKPRHQSEMANQLLFGEGVRVLKQKGALWVKVRSLHDDYQGWMTNTLLQQVNENEAKAHTAYVTLDMISSIHFNNMYMQVPFAASLPAFEKGGGTIAGTVYHLEGRYAKRGQQSFNPQLITQLTTPWLNAPYLWGGRTIFGVDCSGFVQVIFKTMGIDLPRDAWQQAQEGKTVRKLKEAVCGDLAFFDDKEEIVHVGILLDNQHIIHASGKVRIDTIDKKGIIHNSTGKYTHSLRAIKRCG